VQPILLLARKEIKMNCPECKSLIKQEHVGWSMDEEYDYIEVDVECDECGKNFFTRIMPKDLVVDE